MKTITIDDSPAILDLMRFILNKIDPEGSHFFADNAAEGLEIIESQGIRIVFLDIEMPDLTGEDAARLLNERYGMIDLIFITGHSEYALIGHQLHCAAFVTKPFGEKDIAEALKYLRLPAWSPNAIVIRCSEPFGAFFNGEPLQFERGLTAELLAYLVYKNGAIATNGELVGIFWEGNPEKQDRLRKYIKDLRDRFEERGMGEVLVKKRGSIGLNMKKLSLEGSPSELPEQFGWFV